MAAAVSARPTISQLAPEIARPRRKRREPRKTDLGWKTRDESPPGPTIRTGSRFPNSLQPLLEDGSQTFQLLAHSTYSSSLPAAPSAPAPRTPPTEAAESSTATKSASAATPTTAISATTAEHTRKQHCV